MRYNEKELQALSRQPAEMAAELGMRGPKKGSGERPEAPERPGGRAAGGRGWAAAERARARLVPAVVKRRLVKLVVNFLFYFRTDEAEVRRRGGRGRGLGLGSGSGSGVAGGRPQLGGGVWSRGRGGGRFPVPAPMPLSAPSPSEPCCWSTAESLRKSPAASPSVSAAWGEAT